MSEVDAQLAAGLEAILMVVDEPVPAAALAEACGRTTTEVEETLGELQAEYAGHRGTRPRGFALRQVAGGWRIYSASTYHELVATFVVAGRTARLTQAALETLAVIAYKQPVTRSRVAAIRGVNVDSVVRTLQTRGLIEEAGVGPSGATLYVTTPAFLERMGLTDLSELAPLAPYLPGSDELGQIEQDMEGRRL
nr:SMC-Scp complex subunit ScpB [Buchananella hordeovulneris]